MAILIEFETNLDLEPGYQVENFGKIILKQKKSQPIVPLTLIQAAGGVYDFQNFEQEIPNIALSDKKMYNSCIPQKTSQKYILLSTFK